MSSPKDPRCRPSLPGVLCFNVCGMFFRSHIVPYMEWPVNARPAGTHHAFSSSLAAIGTSHARIRCVGDPSLPNIPKTAHWQAGLDGSSRTVGNNRRHPLMDLAASIAPVPCVSSSCGSFGARLTRVSAARAASSGCECCSGMHAVRKLTRPCSRARARSLSSAFTSARARVLVVV